MSLDQTLSKYEIERITFITLLLYELQHFQMMLYFNCCHGNGSGRTNFNIFYSIRPRVLCGMDTRLYQLCIHQIPVFFKWPK